MIEELIRSNKKKSLYLIITSFIIVLIVGFVLGQVIYLYMVPRNTIEYDTNKLNFALGFAAFIGFVELIQIYLIFNGKPRTLLKQLGLKEAPQARFKKLHNVVAEMSIAAGLHPAPKVYIIQSKAVNAMAFGSKPQNSAIAVTAGLLSVCNRDELQGVIAHEISHIINRDSMLLEVCRSTLGMVIVLRDVMLRSMYWGSLGKSNYRSTSSKSRSSKLDIVFMILGIIFAIIAPLLIKLIYFALSRRREYLADAVAAKLTRYPAGLASALTKIAYSTHSLNKVDKVTSAAFIEYPDNDVIVSGRGTATHPPIWNRITILKKMSGGAGYIDYQKAYREVMHPDKAFMPESMADNKFEVPLRGAFALSDEPGVISSAEDMKVLEQEQRTDDVIRLTEDFGFINCECGMNIKIPPDYKKYEVRCPRCGRVHVLEDKMQTALASMLDETVDNGDAAAIINQMIKEDAQQDYSREEKQVYERQGNKWEKIKCRCGADVEISPTFVGKFITCRKCKRKIIIQ